MLFVHFLHSRLPPLGRDRRELAPVISSISETIEGGSKRWLIDPVRQSSNASPCFASHASLDPSAIQRAEALPWPVQS